MDLRTFQDAIIALFSPGLSAANYSARASAFVRSLVGCDMVSVGTLDPLSGELVIDFDDYHGDMPAALEGFAAHMQNLPAFNFDPKVNDGNPFLRSDFYSQRQFYDMPIYTEGFRKARLRDHAAIHIPSSENNILYVGIERSVGKAFSEDDRSVMQCMQPHLANARQMVLAQGALGRHLSDPRAFLSSGLTPREADTLLWLARGKSNQEIALILGITVPTVKGHIVSVFNKLGVDNRHSATLRALDLAHKWRRPNPKGPVRVTAKVPS
ncbi:MAG: helix-turn-helix transcriptional regulator [Verrucomicrobia bacterium]|nr:helix-turn-helix transcriptional regulator [Verrucomicrobiota bacterium]